MSTPRRRPRPRAALLAAVAGLLSACAGARPSLRPTAPPAAGPSPAVHALAEGPAPTPPAAAAEAPPPPSGAPPPRCPAAPGEAVRAAVLERARELVGRRPRLDCSGYVLLAYRTAGLRPALPPRRNRSQALHDAGQPVALPRPGDLAFFQGTTGRQRRDGAGPITHVALVEAVDGDEITLLHRGRRVERFRLDLAHPGDPSRNDPLRVRRPREPAWMRYLAGELLTGFAAFPAAGEAADGEPGPATCRP